MTKYATLFAILISTLITLSCSDEGDDGAGVQKCEDALCYATCLEGDEADYFTESYWSLTSAYCRDDRNCACNFGCDNTACAEYCIELGPFSSGVCQGFGCNCTGGTSEDAGDADPS